MNAVKKIKDADFLFLTSMLRAREVGMLSGDRVNRMLDALGFDDAAKLLLDCGYPDMSDMGMAQVDAVIEAHRAEVFREISGFAYALDILDFFRMKYDYHNIKVLIKASGAGIEAKHLLSSSGRVEADAIADAFVTEQYEGIPAPVAEAIGSAVGILSRTANPQLADIEIDKFYFGELASLAARLKHPFITGYVQLLIDSANLRIIVRSARTRRDKDFLLSSLLPQGSVSVDQLATAYDAGSPPPFTNEALSLAVRLGVDAMSSGTQTIFELACDNAVLQYVTNTNFISFGPAPVICFLAKVEWELTVVRMILTGKHTGISSEVIRERLRECYVL